MRAWRLHELGEPAEVLHLEDVPSPEPGPGEVLIDVAAAALNFPDVLLCRGQYQEKPPLPFVPGVEVAGTVAAIGAGVTRVGPGDRVMALPLSGKGGLTEQTVAVEGSVQKIPEPMGFEAASAFLITYHTGHLALHRRAAIQPGETLLVHAGAGGVGTAAIQLGLAAGARVFATAGGPEKVAVCKKLGAELVVDYRSDDFVEAVKDATQGRGADVIYDPVGGDTFDRSRKCVAFEGRILVIGFTSGRIADAPTNHALIKNYSVVGVHWGLYRKVRPQQFDETQAALVPLVQAGAVNPVISSSVPLDDAPGALTRLGDRATWGKVVVRVRE